MDPVELLAMLGGVARRSDLVPPCTARALARAVSSGRIIHVARGVYALASAGVAEQRRARLCGTLTHLSAAQHHRWEIAREPDLPWVGVPRNRKVSPARRAGVHLTYTDARGVVTSPVRTVVDCGRRLPFWEALAVADSALRHGVPSCDLVAAAAAVRGKGAQACRRVANHATAAAANPLESALRALALDAGLDVSPQLRIELSGRTIWPDLVDVGRRLVLEAEGFHYHGTSLQFSRDVWRYTALVAEGWTVLRFTHRHVMTEQDWVSNVLVRFGETSKRNASGG